MRTTYRIWAALAAIAIVLPAAQGQTAAAVAITGAVRQPLSLTAADLADLPRTEVAAADHGKPAKFEGVLLTTLLRKAGAISDKELHGKDLAAYVLATARDGYRIVYSLAEFDPSLTYSRIILADTMDGKPLPASAGPFRLVAPDDKRMARSVRMVEKIEVVRLDR